MPRDFASNGFGTARELDITSTVQTYRDHVDLLDTRDLYSVTLSGRSSLDLSLNPLQANANVKLFNSSGEVLLKSNNAGGIADTINTVLDAGTYYIAIYRGNASASTFYNLSVAANLVNELTLYDGSLGGTPNSQGSLAFGTVPPFLGTPATQTASGGVTNLVSTVASPGGYSNHNNLSPTLVNSSFPTLDRSTGYTISFDVQINSENHSGSDKDGDGLGDRAGFSVIAMSSDLQGIELGFWNNEIWAQETGTAPPSAGGTLFTHDDLERAFVDTTAMTSYDLTILGNDYHLFADGSLILSGTLRNYSAFDSASAGLPYDPYETPNLVFLGDNTSSAGANINLEFVSVTTYS